MNVTVWTRGAIIRHEATVFYLDVKLQGVNSEKKLSVQTNCVWKAAAYITSDAVIILYLLVKIKFR